MATYVWSKYTLDTKYTVSVGSSSSDRYNGSDYFTIWSGYNVVDDGNGRYRFECAGTELGGIRSYDLVDYIGWYEYTNSIHINKITDVYVGGNYCIVSVDSYWADAVECAGNYIGEVTSSSRESYPDNGSDGYYWYRYKGRLSLEISFILAYPYEGEESELNPGDNVGVNWSVKGNGEVTWHPSDPVYSWRFLREFDLSGVWENIYPQTFEYKIIDTLPSEKHKSVRYKIYEDALGEPKYAISNTLKIVSNSPPSIPSSISVPSSINHGKTITISWGASTDEDGNFSGYEVERLYDSGSWERIYRGTARSFSHTIPRNTYKKVQYRVRAYDTESDYSGYRTSSVCTIINNRAPNSPSAISIPDTIVADGISTFTVSWKASTDPDGNLSGYILERSFDGQVFSQIYKGPLTEFTETTLKIGEHTSVQYRVRAYDTDNAYSAYVTTAIKQIVNNHAPEIISSTHQNNQDIGEVYDDGIQVAYSVTDEDNDAVTAYELINSKLIREYSPNLGNENILNLTGDDWKKVLNGENITRIEATDGKSAMMFTIRFTKKVHHVRVSLKNPLSNGYPITLCKLVVEGNIPEDAIYKVEVTNNGRDDEPIWEDCTDAVRKRIYYRFKNSVHEKGWGLKFRIYCKRGKNGESQAGGYILFVNGVYG